ncbi:hemerythrin-like domain-containing protein [Pedobacter sp. UYP24]
MKSKPIKRSDYVVALSRDHHSGLLFCWKIKEGLKKGASFQRINNYIIYYWNNHLLDHFQEEEVLLFNQIESENTKRAILEHLMLAEWFERIKNGDLPKKEEYLQFCEILISHIRFEERELFPFLETALAEHTLNGIRDILFKIHLNPFKENYPDEFWILPKVVPLSATNTINDSQTNLYFEI